MPDTIVHLVRHGRVASHRGDVPVAPEGFAEIETAGRRLAAGMQSGEIVHLLTTATVRSRDTAAALHQLLEDQVDKRGAMILPPREEWAIRNPDLFVAGRRVEMVSNAQAMFELFPDLGLGAEEIDGIPFYHRFFRDRDRVGYWLREQHPPGEDAHSVGRRVVAWALSLSQRQGSGIQRYICVTHSPVMRAVLTQYVLAEDPGEPDWVESIDICVTGEAADIRFRGDCAELATS